MEYDTNKFVAVQLRVAAECLCNIWIADARAKSEKLLRLTVLLGHRQILFGYLSASIYVRGNEFVNKIILGSQFPVLEQSRRLRLSPCYDVTSVIAQSILSRESKSSC